MLWRRLQARFPNNLEFVHSHGLGVLQLNNATDDQRLQWLQPDLLEKQLLISYFAALGARQLDRFELNELKQHANSLNQAVVEREGQMADLAHAVHDKDVHIANLEEVIGVREQQIIALNQAVHDKDVHIVNLEAVIGGREQQIAALNQAVAERDAQMAYLHQTVAERDREIELYIAEKNNITEDICVVIKASRLNKPIY